MELAALLAIVAAASTLDFRNGSRDAADAMAMRDALITDAATAGRDELPV